jgi:hypothetical protein
VISFLGLKLPSNALQITICDHQNKKEAKHMSKKLPSLWIESYPENKVHTRTGIAVDV